MKILIGADFVPTKSNEKLCAVGDDAQLFGKELTDLLRKATYKVFNLEVPFTYTEEPIVKCGPNLIAAPETVEIYKKINVNLLTLANNHILDQGEQGLNSTLNVLNDAGIAYTGVGENIFEASKPFVEILEGKKIGIYACAEHEFSIATETKTGANPFDPLNSLDHIENLKKKCDYVIVLYHGGKEHYRYPSPNLQKSCRKMVNKGADLVVCQHSHCIGCEEKYDGGTIVYGQGNFLFDDCENEFWQTSLLIAIDDSLEISYIPIVKNKNMVRLADGDCAAKILEDFNSRSEKIKNSEFVKEEYKKFGNLMLNGYLLRFSCVNRTRFVYKALNKISGRRLDKFLIKRFNKSQKTLLRNIVECEAHRELLLNGLKNVR